MEIKDNNYRIFYDSEQTRVQFQGSLRLSGMADYAPIVDLLNQVIEQKASTILLDLKELEFMNSSGISMLSRFVINVRKQNVSKIIIKASNSIPWQGKSLKNLQRLMPSLILDLE